MTTQTHDYGPIYKVLDQVISGYIKHHCHPNQIELAYMRRYSETEKQEYEAQKALALKLQKKWKAFYKDAKANPKDYSTLNSFCIFFKSLLGGDPDDVDCSVIFELNQFLVENSDSVSTYSVQVFLLVHALVHLRLGMKSGDVFERQVSNFVCDLFMLCALGDMSKSFDQLAIRFLVDCWQNYAVLDPFGTDSVNQIITGYACSLCQLKLDKSKPLTFRSYLSNLSPIAKQKYKTWLASSFTPRVIRAADNADKKALNKAIDLGFDPVLLYKLYALED
jgi:hypothetical protein